ncbi:MAG TPA: hypothetical protein VF773_05380 [Verrucomicrobiae bacterium]
MASLPAHRYLDVYSSDQKASSVLGKWNLAAVFAPTVGTTVLAFRQNAVQSADLTSLSNRLLECFETAYGYHYDRLQSKGPTLFAFGLVSGLGFGPEDMLEADAIARWGRAGIDDRGYLRGALRDVFPNNILTGAHLAAAVENCTLESWIHSCKDRGTLLKLNGDQYIWSVEPQQIASVHLALAKAGLLLSHNDAIARP